MKDPLFIEQMLEKGKEAAKKVQHEFAALSSEQLNLRPSPDSWSVGQCLDHLVTADCSYFPVLRKIIEGKHKMVFWEKWSPFSGLFGKILVTQLQEKVTRKIKTPNVFTPSTSKIDLGIMERFQKHQDTLLEYINGCKTIDIDKTYITSPVWKFVTYNLRNAITILIQHQHRHINQAVQVRKYKM